MEHLHGWFVAAAYAFFALMLVADALLPRYRFTALLRAIRRREQRSKASADTP